jgi:hypothetical protein
MHIKTTARVLLASISLSALSSLALAQTSTDQPFRFPPSFLGEDCDALASSIKQANVRKDEFETSSAFTARLQALLDQPLASGRKLSEPMYFVNSDRVSAVYDADRGSMKVYGSLRQSTRISDSIRFAGTVVVKKRSAESSEYQAQNRIGASTTVQRYRDEICGVAFTNLSPVTDHQWMGLIEFPLSVETAKASKGNIGIVYLAKLTPPLLIEHRQRVAPTMTSPVEILVTGDALTAVLERFYVINKLTGEVLFDRIYTPR